MHDSFLFYPRVLYPSSYQFFFVFRNGKPLACGCWIVFAWHASQIYQKASWVWYLCVEDSKELSVSDIISAGILLFSPCFNSSHSFQLPLNFGTWQMRWKHHICSIIIIIAMHGWFWFDEFWMVDRARSARNLSYQINISIENILFMGAMNIGWMLVLCRWYLAGDNKEHSHLEIINRFY